MEKTPLTFRQKDLLLMPFPYSDLSQTKVRPVLVVSNDRYNAHSGDLIVCCVTSAISHEFYTVVLTPDSLEEGWITENCGVKTENIAKIDKSKVIKKIGRLKEKSFALVLEKIRMLF